MMNPNFAPTGLLLDQIVKRLGDLTNYNITSLPNVSAEDLKEINMPIAQVRIMLELFEGNVTDECEHV